MNLNSRLSSLATTILCAFTFLFVATTAPAVAAKKERVVGTLETENGVTISVNGRTAANGAELRCGDVLETTGDSVKVALGSQGEYVVDAGTRVRLTCSSGGKVNLLVVYGGVHPVGSDHDNDFIGLPYIGAFGFGNLQSGFPSTGGGPQSSSSGRIPIVNSKGVVIGYALTDALGRVVGFTDPSGKLLASTPPNGTPVSKVFGPGAVLL